MKRMLIALLPVLMATGCIKDRLQPVAGPVVVSSNDTVMYYWSFNNFDSSTRTPDFGVISGATFNYWAAYIDTTSGSSVDLLSGAPYADSGSSLRVRNPSDSLVFYMPTTGYDSVALQYAEEASSTTSGSTINYIHYTTDGVHFITNSNITSSFNTIGITFASYAIDFSADPATSNNPKFAVSIVMGNNNTGTSGNDRFDNVTLLGKRK